MYNAMNISPRSYMPNGQGYKQEDESEEKTHDSLQENPQRNRRDSNPQESRTVARGRAPLPERNNPPVAGGSRPAPLVAGGSKPAPPVAGGRNIQPVTMGVGPRELPPKPVRNNQTVPQEKARMPQQMGQPMVNRPVSTPMTAHNMPNQNIQQNYTQQPVMQQSPVQQSVQPQVNHQPINNQYAQGVQNNQIPNATQTSQNTQGPQSAKQTQINNMARNNKVNIAQVIKDFRGTIAAIGTPNCLVDEIEDYLNKVIDHTKGDAPSINFVQTNLLNAAVILDKYISDTLEKESRVVQNWLEALFLQRINYSYNDTEINEDFLVKFPKDEQTPQEKSTVEEIKTDEPIVQQEIPDYEPIVQEPVQNVQQVQQPVRQTVPIRPAQQRVQPMVQPQRVVQRVVETPQQVAVQKPKLTIIPEDNELKSLFIQAKKHAYSNNPAKAMNILEKALTRAESVKDEDAQSKICYEMGKIYDDNNYLAQALNNYNRSLQVTTDTSMKTKAHYSMAKIYDDVNQLDSAVQHYMNSVSYAGKEDNLSSQSKSLTNIGNIYTDKYNPDAFVFYDEADILVTQTDDSEMKGYVSSNTAGAFNKFNLPEKALQCYASAVKSYADAKQNNNVAENYKAAGELMYDLKYPAKAKTLLRKALAHTDKYKDIELINEINDLLEEIG